MKNISTFIVSRFNLRKVLILGFISFFALGATFTFAATVSNFKQVITAGTLSVDIVDAALAPVASPAVTLASTGFSFSCQTTVGTFGTTSEQIYMQNPGASNSGFTVSLAASAPTALWSSAGKAFDFNDPTTAGCADGADTDTFGGQMTVNASAGTLVKGNCVGCSTTGITLGSSASFNQGVTDSITLVTAAAGSDDIGDWKLQGVGISQTIPPEQPPATDYNINLTLSIVTS